MKFSLKSKIIGGARSLKYRWVRFCKNVKASYIIARTIFSKSGFNTNTMLDGLAIVKPIQAESFRFYHNLMTTAVASHEEFLVTQKKVIITFEMEAQ